MVTAEQIDAADAQLLRMLDGLALQPATHAAAPHIQQPQQHGQQKRERQRDGARDQHRAQVAAFAKLLDRQFQRRGGHLRFNARRLRRAFHRVLKQHGEHQLVIHQHGGAFLAVEQTDAVDAPLGQHPGNARLDHLDACFGRPALRGGTQRGHGPVHRLDRRRWRRQDRAFDNAHRCDLICRDRFCGLLFDDGVGQLLRGPQRQWKDQAKRQAQGTGATRQETAIQRHGTPSTWRPATDGSLRRRRTPCCAPGSVFAAVPSVH